MFDLKNVLSLCLMIVMVALQRIMMTSCEYHSYPCVHHGHLRTDDDWFGFLANMTILKSGRISFEFSFPAESCCINVLFYNEAQMYALNSHMNCWQKEDLVRPEDDQILRLTPSFTL